MRGIFVGGTDTDIGKTFVSSLICHGLSKKTSVAYYKPVQAGEPTDFARVAKLCPQVNIAPPAYNLKQPASPNRAARQESLTISTDKIVQQWKRIEADFVVVEGAGGMMVPLNKEEYVYDISKKLEMPCLVVASTRLGTINHTLLTIELLKAKKIPIIGIVLNGPEDGDLKQVIEEQSGVPVLFELKQWEAESTAVFESIIAENEDFRGFLDFCQTQEVRENEVIKDLEQDDKDFVWHPFTQHGIVKNHPLVSRGEGAYLKVNGNWVLDGISSWWVNLFGHARLELSLAIKNQVDLLEHVIFAGFTHEPAVKLAQRLIDLNRSRGALLDKVFFSDNGSTSVEVALKMAYQYHQQKGNLKRKKFLAFKGSYHGDTMGAMSVGERVGFNQIFNPLMFDVDFVDPFSKPEIEQVFAKSGEEYAGVILEPMVQGASGMRMYPREVLDRVETLANEYGVFKICDEVFTGFYRTGKMFAYEHSHLRPDFLCLSKGLTGGFLPLAVTLTKQSIYDYFNNSDMKQAFLHGHSYTANPLACAAANATLELLEQQEVLTKIANIEKWTAECVQDYFTTEKFFNQRSLGTIGAVDVSKEDPGYFKGDFSYKFNQAALKKGVLLRPLGGTIYAVPPYCVEKSELQKIYQTIVTTMKEEF